MNTSGKAVSRFVEASLKLVESAIQVRPDALVLVGGIQEGSGVRQDEILEVINDVHRRGARAYWYKAQKNANLNIPDQVVPGQSYVVIDLDTLSASSAATR